MSSASFSPPYTGDGVILDRSVYSDSVFANVCRNEGFISSDGVCVCVCVWSKGPVLFLSTSLLNSLSLSLSLSLSGYQQYRYWRKKALEHLPVPHVTLFLDAPPHICHSRIHQRGRVRNFTTALKAPMLPFLPPLPGVWRWGAPGLPQKATPGVFNIPRHYEVSLPTYVILILLKDVYHSLVEQIINLFHNLLNWFKLPAHAGYLRTCTCTYMWGLCKHTMYLWWVFSLEH